MFVGLIDVCAQRLNLVAISHQLQNQPVHYITGLHVLTSEALQKKATLVYTQCLIARVNRPVTTLCTAHTHAGEDIHT